MTSKPSKSSFVYKFILLTSDIKIFYIPNERIVNPGITFAVNM